MTTRRVERVTQVQLGRNVTSLAAAKEKKGTVVLSVRLSVDDLAKLEAVSHITGNDSSTRERSLIEIHSHYNSPPKCHHHRA